MLNRATMVRTLVPYGSNDADLCILPLDGPDPECVIGNGSTAVAVEVPVERTKHS